MKKSVDYILPLFIVAWVCLMIFVFFYDVAPQIGGAVFAVAFLALLDIVLILMDLKSWFKSVAVVFLGGAFLKSSEQIKKYYIIVVLVFLASAVFFGWSILVAKTFFLGFIATLIFEALILVMFITIAVFYTAFESMFSKKEDTAPLSTKTN